MNAADRKLHNLARLVGGSDRKLIDIALRAWPVPERQTAYQFSLSAEVRRKRLLRYLEGKVVPPDEACDELARALGVDVSEFFRPPTATN